MNRKKILVAGAGNEVGIENLKVALGFGLTAVNEGFDIDKNNDKEIDVGEIFAVVTAISFEFPQLRKALPFLDKERKDLTPEEIDELLLFVNDELDLPAKFDNLEEVIKIIVNAVNYNLRVARKLKALLRKDEEAAA